MERERRQLRDRRPPSASALDSNLSSSSSSSSRKRTAAKEDCGEEDGSEINVERVEKSAGSDYTFLKPNLYRGSDVTEIVVTNHEATRWDRLPPDAQNRCCASATRLVLFKGI